MAIYAVGDLQGCADALVSLLDVIEFDPETDQLWLAGDLVNRGPDSLKALNLVKNLGQSAVAVLGNHDLHLLAVASGVKPERRSDTLSEILRAANGEELIHWLRHRPLLHHCADHHALMVHAGIYPGWGFSEACRYAKEVESVLRSSDYVEFLRNMYGKTPVKWNEDLSGWDRLRFITNAFTRMRYCDQQRQLDFVQKGAPKTAPRHLMPWFEHAALKCRSWRILFGHWSTLGYFHNDRVTALDTGCVWGGKLTAVRVDTTRSEEHWQVP